MQQESERKREKKRSLKKLRIRKLDDFRQDKLIIQQTVPDTENAQMKRQSFLLKNAMV